MTGTLQLFQDDQDLALPAGTTHVHLPQVWLGHQNPAEPTLSFWVERVLEVEEVPRVIKDLYEMSFDAVTLALKTPGILQPTGFEHVLQAFDMCCLC